ncbi:MAG: hypothetical protein ACK515_19700 [bacterium]|jgi:hypothetical protein|nr:hypothetical protein [Betaproteobacteria bacterium]
MQVVPIETRELTTSATQLRQGVIKAYRLIEGEPGLGNFALRLVNIAGDFLSPRHRHNFDQFRMQLEGTYDYGPDGKFTPGSVGYFPEGVYYGPQTSSGDTWNLLLQFAGASRSGYTSEAEGNRAADELKTRGTFEKGVYTTYREDGKKVNKDAYEAVWEHVHGRKLEYPKPRYEKPVFLRADHFDWQPAPGLSGVAHKPLGSFTECEASAALYRVDAGASLPLSGRALYFVLRGNGSIGDSPVARHTSLYLLAGEAATLAVSGELELVRLGLPKIEGA